MLHNNRSVKCFANNELEIRCSGSDQSEDGRCANCQRHAQECIFTPASAQVQAFVPAHVVYGRGSDLGDVQLFGAYGQPLPLPQPSHHHRHANCQLPGNTLLVSSAATPTLSYYPPPQEVRKRVTGHKRTSD